MGRFRRVKILGTLGSEISEVMIWNLRLHFTDDHMLAKVLVAGKKLDDTKLIAEELLKLQYKKWGR